MYNPADRLIEDTANYIHYITYEKALRDGKSKEEAKKLANKAKREFKEKNPRKL